MFPTIFLCTYHHERCEFEFRSGEVYSIQHYDYNYGCSFCSLFFYLLPPLELVVVVVMVFNATFNNISFGIINSLTNYNIKLINKITCSNFISLYLHFSELMRTCFELYSTSLSLNSS
jgi:hypothetical protein